MRVERSLLKSAFGACLLGIPKNKDTSLYLPTRATEACNQICPKNAQLTKRGLERRNNKIMFDAVFVRHRKIFSRSSAAADFSRFSRSSAGT
eukprot:1161612-Pelagomonas_calceolata.AAC.1